MKAQCRLLDEQLEDTIGVVKNRKYKKDSQYSDQKKKDKKNQRCSTKHYT
jgi:hypothetical protein